MNINISSVSFGTIVIGEKLNRKVQLINKGALGTNFKIICPVKSEKNKLTSHNDDGIKLGDVSVV